MLNPFKFLEKILYKVRNFFWDYPDKLFGENSLRTNFIEVYKATSPYSHFILATILVVILIFLFSGGRYKNIVNASDNKELIEAVVMGTDDQGRLQKLNKVNPLLPSNIQLEKDLSDLIYEPLVNYEYVKNADGTSTPEVVNVLADSVIKIKEGADYQFNLKKGVLWHDGVEFTADDVIATFNLVSQLQKNDNAFIQAIKLMRWEKVGTYSIRVCTKGSDPNASCNDAQDKPIISNFLEVIGIKILPAHKIKDINSSTLENFDADIFTSPVGTGKYKFLSVTDQSITLERNDDYIYPAGENTPQISTIEFKFYKTLGDAVQAIQNGEAHSLASISVEYKNDIQTDSNIKVNLSPVLDNQYWGLYFNLKKDPSGKTIGPDFFSNVNVRQAISSAISRYEVINDALLGVGEEAFGPITQKSQYFDKDAGWFTYDPQKAATLLDQAGWTLKPGEKIRTDSKGNELQFSLYYVDNYDRINIARVVQKDLAAVGISVIINRQEEPGQDTSSNGPSGWSLDDLNREILAPRSFDMLLYGVDTFIDPDRYELFDSAEQNDPGLNISSYVGSTMTKVANDNKKSVSDPDLLDVPKVDNDLEEGRTKASDDPSKQKLYDDFQTQVAQDTPVVFLYHPQFIYYTNANVKKIDLTDVSSVEDRFRNIQNWVLK